MGTQLKNSEGSPEYTGDETYINLENKQHVQQGDVEMAEMADGIKNFVNKYWYPIIVAFIVIAAIRIYCGI